MSNNIVTVILIFAIIVVLILIGVFIFQYREVFLGEENAIVTENFLHTNTMGVSKSTNTQESESTINTVENNEEEISIQAEDEGTDSMLTQIIDRFNSCSATQEMRQLGYTMYATAQANTLNIISTGDGLYFNVNFMLEDNILFTEIENNTTEPREPIIRTMLGISLVDCVSQIKGYPEKTLTQALNDDAAMNYTLENEGVEIKSLNNGGLTIRIDLNSNLSFLNT